MGELDHHESWVLKNWCFWTVELEKTLESPLDCKGIQQVHPKGNQSWIFIGKTDVEAETPILWHLIWRTDSLERPWCWERLKAEGEGDDRGWDGWMVSLTQWTWVWASSRSWWWTGRPGMLLAMESQRVGHDWATELTDWLKKVYGVPCIHSFYLHSFKSPFSGEKKDLRTTLSIPLCSGHFAYGNLK